MFEKGLYEGGGRKVLTWIPNDKDELERGSRTESRPTRTTERGKGVVATRTSYADQIDTLIEAMASIGWNCAPLTIITCAG